MSKIRDYILLDTDDFEQKHGQEEYDNTRELARKQVYHDKNKKIYH